MDIVMDIVDIVMDIVDIVMDIVMDANKRSDIMASFDPRWNLSLPSTRNHGKCASC